MNFQKLGYDACMRNAFVLLLGCVGAQAMAAPFVRVANSNWTIELVNVATNSGVPIVSLSFPTNSLAVAPSGALYVADPVGNLWDVAGAPIPAGSTGRADIGDLDWSGTGMWGFSNATSELFFFDTGSSSVTYSQGLSLPSGLSVSGVAHQDSTGDTYLSAFDAGLNTYLFKNPASSASLNLIGTMLHTDAASYVADIEFDAAGTLYGVTWFHRHFLTVNPLTAATSTVSAGPHRDSTAFALRPVPEPASIFALGIGIMGAIRKKRLREPRL